MSINSIVPLSVVNNHSSDVTSNMSYLFDMIFGMMQDFVELLRSFKFFGDVSYFDFFVALMIMGIVITYLLNVAKNPGVETTSTTRARERRKAADAERKKS